MSLAAKNREHKYRTVLYEDTFGENNELSQEKGDRF
jgi:hypothetical protein